MAVRVTPSGMQSYANVPSSRTILSGRTGGTSSGSSRRSSSQPSVSVSGNTVFINGQGFSVAPSLQADFIRQKTGGSGASAQAAILQASQQEQLLREQQAALKSQQEQAKVQAQYKTILDARSRIIGRGGRESVTSSKDWKTGDQLKITSWKLGSNTVRKIENLSRGIVTFNQFSPGRAGGSVQHVGGVMVGATPTMKEVPSVIAGQVKISQSNVAGKVLVTLPDGQKFNISSTGRVTLGKEIAGRNYVFENGKVVKVDGQWSDQRDIYEPSLTVETVEQPKGSVNKIIKQLNDLQSKASTSSIRNKQTNLINELKLLGLSVGTTVISGVVGFVALPSIVLNLVKNPSQILAIPGAISQGAKEFGQVIMISPTEALGKIGGEVMLLYGGGLAFKVVGKVSSRIKIAATPLFNKADKIRISVQGKTIRVLKKAPVIKGVLEKVGVVRKIQAEEIAKFRSVVEYSNLLDKAKKIRKLARVKGATINIGNRDFIKAVAYVEEFADDFAKIKAKEILRKMKNSGVKVGLGDEARFIERIRGYVKENLNKYPRFRELKEASRLTDPFQIRLLKVKKVGYIKNIIKNVNLKVKNLPIAKKVVDITKKIRSKIRIIKKPKKIKFNQFKPAEEYVSQLRNARRIRRLARAKGRTINIGNRDFIKAVDYIEDFADEFAKIRAKQMLDNIKKSGTKLGAGDEQRFIDSIRKYVKDSLNKNSQFIELRRTAKLSEPFQIRLLKTKKINYANKLVKNISLKIKNLPISKKVSEIFRKFRSKITRFNKLPQRIKKSLASRTIRREGRLRFMETNKYLMQKNRHIRKVTIERLRKTNTITTMNKFVDDFFNEVGRRQRVDVSGLQFSQFKNIIKKKLSRAIKSGNKVEINKFVESIKKISSDMNKPASLPDVIVVKKFGKDRAPRTIREFRPEAPSGQYQEIKSGQQVLLQKMDELQRAKTLQVMPEIKSVFVVKAVYKKPISLTPLIDFGVGSVARSGLRFFSKVSQDKAVFGKVKDRQIFGMPQDSKQDFRVLQKFAQASGQVLDVAQRMAQDSATKQITKQRLKQKPISKTQKQKIIKRVIPQIFTKRVLNKSIQSYYVRIKQRGKIINLTQRPLSLSDAKDFLAYKVDNELSRSAWIEPIGKTKNVVGLPNSIKGYFAKNSNKLRPFKIRMGKKKAIRMGYIEKRKFAFDRPGERRQLRSIQTKTIRRPIRRSPTMALQKQRLINLAKARAKLKMMRSRRKR